jgi:hypothetical protein
MAKMAAQVFGIAMVESQENTCSTLLTSVSYSNLPTTFVGGVSSGISRIRQGDPEVSGSSKGTVAKGYRIRLVGIQQWPGP